MPDDMFGEREITANELLEYIRRLERSPNPRSNERARMLREEFNRIRGRGLSDDEAASQAFKRFRHRLYREEEGIIPYWRKRVGNLFRSPGGREGELGWWERHLLFEQIIKGLLIWFIITAIGWVISNLVWVNIIGNFWWFMIGGFCLGMSVMDFTDAPAYQYTRAMLRGIGIYFVGVSAWVVYKLIGLLVVFFGYMTLPVRIRGGMAYESALAGIRFLLGLVMTFFVFNMIGGVGMIKWGLTLIVAGFFATLPEISPGTAETGGKSGRALSVVVNAGGEAEQLGSKMMSGGACFLGTILGMIHFITAGQGAFPIFTFALFGTVATVTAFTTPAPVRGIAGMPYVLIVFVVTGVMFPGVVGKAFFGAWWPTIQTRLEETFGPIAETMSESMETFKFGFNCLRDPVGCARRWEPHATTEKGVYAVDINKIEPLVEDIKKYPTKENPYELKAMIEIENKGERIAKNITIELLIPKSGEIRKVGKPKGIKCGEEKTSGKNVSCTIDKLYPGEIRQIMATYKITGEEGIKPGDYVEFGARASYSYSVNATLDVEVWDSGYYERMAMKKAVSPHYVTSKDTGGVVGLGISAHLKQPVRDDIGEVPVFIALQNRGNGYVPKGGIVKAQVDVDGLGNITKEDEISEDKICSSEKEFKRLEAYLPIKEDKSAKDVCMVKLVDIPGPNVTKRTFGINGFAKYKYAVEGFGKVKLAFSAIKCVCEDGTKPSVYTCIECEEICEDHEGVKTSVIETWKKLYEEGSTKYGKCVR